MKVEQTNSRTLVVRGITIAEGERLVWPTGFDWRDDRQLARNVFTWAHLVGQPIFEYEAGNEYDLTPSVRRSSSRSVSLHIPEMVIDAEVRDGSFVEEATGFRRHEDHFSLGSAGVFVIGYKEEQARRLTSTHYYNIPPGHESLVVYGAVAMMQAA